MEQFKRAKVFVLEAKQSPQVGDICYISVIGWFICTKEHLKENVIANLIEYKSVKVYKMYITEYKEIENNDYFFTQYFPNTFVLGKRLKSIYNIKDNKVIAIFGNHIYPPCNGHCSNKYICTYPQPSLNFVIKWIEEANKDNIITDVLVKYERDYTNRNCNTCNLGTNGTCELGLEKECCSNTKDASNHKDYWISCLKGEKDSEIYKLKINPKDNTITIKKLKELYTKEELCQVLEKYTSFIWSEVGIHYPISLGIDAKDKFINNEL